MNSKSPVSASCQTVDTDRLVRQHLPLVRQIAKRYSRVHPGHYDDLLQVGCLGLLKAIRSYDPYRQHKASFRTFALCFIKGEIRHYLRDHTSLVQVPRRLNEIGMKIFQAEERLTQELSRTPSARELADYTGYTVADVLAARQSWESCSHYESLDAESDADESARALSELVADHRQQDAVTSSEEREVLGQALVKLGDKARQIIEFVYFYDLTQKETAQILGLSEMGVSRAAKSALKKLHDVLFTEIF